ncbi:T9SS C-terminal target domain-containing protein [Dokdonia sinensis]|uniref:T9SS C-terminal target domain-containing protein n=1 Tax=Dokdonia sinensis TaxID=2479847 RepID=A0A3M0FVI2_9FLAO|nr:T9SS type A sorting domain-containing protein [Dokdonia sinensis]RMB56790.1 T9SS C-terminal target domain-containing protein [Dokdonia sinensis]
MKKTLLIIFGLSVLASHGQIIWTGPDVTFEKENFADWTLAQNQDRMTDNVWITRADRFGIFNIAQEEEYDTTDFLSPIDTEWAFGNTSEIETLTFLPWDDAVDMPPQAVGQEMVVHLITDDIYVDITFTSWSSGNGQGGTSGGGLSYVRSSDQNLSISEETLHAVVVYPNPTENFITIDQSTLDASTYEIFSVLGQKVGQGNLSYSRDVVNVERLSAGIYVLKLNNGKNIRFIKQ